MQSHQGHHDITAVLNSLKDVFHALFGFEQKIIRKTGIFVKINTN